jgi:hypothetical protein
MSDKIDFKPKFIKKDKEGHHTVRGKNPSQIHSNYSMYVPNIGALNFTILDTKGQIGPDMIIVGDFNVTVS